MFNKNECKTKKKIKHFVNTTFSVVLSFYIVFFTATRAEL